MLCKLCLTESEQGAKAHIVPEAFFRFARGSDNTLATVSTDGSQYVKRSPVGPYDTNLVCRSCERLFGPWDDYAARFLLQQIEAQGEPVPGRRGNLLGYQYSPFDYAKLRLFALSLLWRAAASELDHFSQVKPGRDRVEKLRMMLLSADPGTPDVFACYYGRWIFPRETPEFAMLHMNPAYGKIAGLGRVRFYLGPTFLDVKVDVRPWSRALNSLVVRPGLSLLMPAFEFKESFEFRECVVPAMAINSDQLTRLFGGDPEA